MDIIICTWHYLIFWNVNILLKISCLFSFLKNQQLFDYNFIMPLEVSGGFQKSHWHFYLFSIYWILENPKSLLTIITLSIEIVLNPIFSIRYSNSSSINPDGKIWNYEILPFNWFAINNEITVSHFYWKDILLNLCHKETTQFRKGQRLLKKTRHFFYWNSNIVFIPDKVYKSGYLVERLCEL